MCTSSPHLSNKDGITGIPTQGYSHTHMLSLSSHCAGSVTGLCWLIYVRARHIAFNTKQYSFNQKHPMCCLLAQGNKLGSICKSNKVYLSEVLWLHRCPKITRECVFPHVFEGFCVWAHVRPACLLLPSAGISMILQLVFTIIYKDLIPKIVNLIHTQTHTLSGASHKIYCS